MTLQATASLNGVDQPILTINAANAGGIPANSVVAYTSAWGSQIRGRGMTASTNVAEVLVQDDKVVQVNPSAGTGAIPETVRTTSSAATPAPTPSRRSRPATRSR